MTGYYSQKLAAKRLEECYRIAPPRVVQYLEAELAHVLTRIQPGDEVLDEGCGYGRVMPSLAAKAGLVVGIDTSMASLCAARDRVRQFGSCYLACMDAAHTAFADQTFDVIVCIQNGISAFQVDRRELIRECLRITRPGGTVLLSSYSSSFWEDRLHWFRLQAKAGLLGEIDEEQTRDGVIVCKDGFRASTVDARDFRELTAGIDGRVEIKEIDRSSLFCEIYKSV